VAFLAAVFLAPVAFRVAVFLAAEVFAVALRAGDFFAVVFLAPVAFLVGDFLAVDFRVVFLAAGFAADFAADFAAPTGLFTAFFADRLAVAVVATIASLKGCRPAARPELFVVVRMTLFDTLLCDLSNFGASRKPPAHGTFLRVVDVVGDASGHVSFAARSHSPRFSLYTRENATSGRMLPWQS
jgi:hypothetical protein